MDEDKMKEAMSYIPIILDQLDEDGKDMLAIVLQTYLEIGQV